ncbi:hypothetical protein niasHT_037432 [Heterodera trifolii]|uniref:BTB domain-containing protein n=1 Tax=Heterodera trifolii TaxID=157864 RepID=A0ABD2J5B0_9BILA
MAENIFDQFIVVDEKAFTEFISEMDEPKCYNHYNNSCAKCTAPRKNKTNFVALAHSAASFRYSRTPLTPFCRAHRAVQKSRWYREFILNNRERYLQIKCIGSASEPPADVPLAQIIQWQCDGNGKQVIQTSKMIKAGETVEFGLYSLCSVVIRILKKREKSAENLGPPINLPDDQFTVHIGEKKVDVSSHFLMSVSSVINRMLSVEMKEKQQRSLTLDELGVDMEQFMEFVEAISTTATHKPILPNPKNVLILLKLADYFQVDWLKSRCEAHLINCPEIALIDRFLLIDHYCLDNFKANRDQLSPGQTAVSDQLLGELVNRL